MFGVLAILAAVGSLKGHSENWNVLEKPLGMGLMGAKAQTQPPVPTAHSGHCLPWRAPLSLQKEPQLCICSFCSDFRAFRMLTIPGSASPVCHGAGPPAHLSWCLLQFHRDLGVQLR